tara:strand:+ start:178 stop:339 length:162 start_codon:yes stop_codon:yes gene_type:complete
MRGDFFGHAARDGGKVPTRIRVVKVKKHPKKNKAARGAEAMARVMQRVLTRKG